MTSNTESGFEKHTLGSTTCLAIVAKFGRHTKGKFQVSKAAKDLSSKRGKLFAKISETYLFEYNHAHVIDREYYDHAGFLFTHVLHPLNWIGFLEETSEGDRLSDCTYRKTPLWRAYLQLETDDMAHVRNVSINAARNQAAIVASTSSSAASIMF